jgi:hypothetical protein
MDQFVLYVGTDVKDPNIGEAADAAVQTVFYKKDFVEALVDQPHLVGAAVLLNGIDDAWSALIGSVTRSFPLLPLLIAATSHGEAHLSDASSVTAVTIDTNDRSAVERILEHFLAEPGQRDRREYHRFDFPLQARLQSSDEPLHDIRQISAGGAFLVPGGTTPPTGTDCEIEILFQNFAINTVCRILDPRDSSSNLGPGFGIRFTSLSPAAASFIDRTVQDALVAVLTDPGYEPEVPTLDEDADLLSIGDEFTLEI